MALLARIDDEKNNDKLIGSRVFVMCTTNSIYDTLLYIILVCRLGISNDCKPFFVLTDIIYQPQDHVIM